MPQSGIRLDSAQIPNPFVGLAANTFPDTDSALLTLVDGGEDGETTPFQPLLVKARGIDTIIAIDAVSPCVVRYRLQGRSSFVEYSQQIPRTTSLTGALSS